MQRSRAARVRGAVRSRRPRAPASLPRAGDGEPLVLVHGLGGRPPRTGSPSRRGSCPARPVLVPELPGHGGSSPLPAAPSLKPYADRLALLLEHEGAAPAAVVGHSLGGAIALRLAIRRPETVRAVVLAGSAGISSATRARPLRADDHRDPQARPQDRAAPRPGRALAVPEAARLRALGRVRPTGAAGTRSSRGSSPAPRGTPTPSAPRRRSSATTCGSTSIAFACPALVLWGARDNQLPVDDAFEYARRLRRRYA